MVHGFPSRVGRAKHNGPVTGLSAKLGQHVGVRPGRQAGERHAVHPVEDHATRTFQKFTFLLKMRQVDDFGDVEVFGQVVDNIGATFEPPVFGLHRIQHHRATGVERHPVIRENGVGRIRIGRILIHQHVDPDCPHLAYHFIELAEGIFLGYIFRLRS